MTMAKTTVTVQCTPRGQWKTPNKNKKQKPSNLFHWKGLYAEGRAKQRRGSYPSDLHHTHPFSISKRE